MAKQKYRGRSLEVLAKLPSSAMVTIAELLEYQQISYSAYYKALPSGRFGERHEISPGCIRHRAADMRGEG